MKQDLKSKNTFLVNRNFLKQFLYISVFLILQLFILPGKSFAQNITVKGRVVNDANDRRDRRGRA
jgi:hypothetical protein